MIYSKKKIIENWSLTKKRSVKLFNPVNSNDIKEILNQFKNKGENFSIIGSGNSYGDCALNKSNIIDINNFNKILQINYKKKFVIVESGVKLKDLLNVLIPKKLILNNLPGSPNATIGGAIGSNVHGKDSFKNGVFGNNIISLKILNKLGKIEFLNKKNPKFKLFIGTHGVSGVILEAKLSLTKIKSNSLEVITKKFSKYRDVIELFKEYKKKNYIYMGCWIDHFSQNGRGVFKAAKWEKSNTTKFNKIGFNKNFLIKSFYFVLYLFLKLIVFNKFGIKIFNNIIFYTSSNKKEKNIQFKNFYYPQENLLPDEAKLYKNGKVNIQILIPKKNFFYNLNRINDLCDEYSFSSWWLGMKEHKKENYINNFAIDGYDITLQWSKKYIEKKKFKQFYRKLINIVIDSNSTIYLAQDILLSKSNYAKIFCNKKFNKYIKKNFINGIYNNDLYSRILN